MTRPTANTRQLTFAAIALLVAILSIVVRFHFIETRPLSGRLDGQEPESHVLVTDIAFTQTSVSVHKFLPIFTLGARYNKFIDQHPGAATPDASGNYFYTSTPPLTFVIPYFAVGGHPTVVALRWYNVALQCLAAMALGCLVLLSMRQLNSSATVRGTLALTSVIVYMTAPECLRSHSINLWAQQFYAVLLPVQIILLLFRPNRFALFFAAFIGCLADWTAYVASLGMAAVALYDFKRTGNRRSLESAAAILLGAITGGIAMITWFAQVMPVADYFHDLAQRSEARSVGGLLKLLLFIPRYSESFGLFLPLAILVAFWWARTSRRTQPDLPVERVALNPLKAAIFILVCAVGENLLMKDHALLYSYDRLKGVQLLALVIVWCGAYGQRAAAPVFGISAATGVASLLFFHLSYETPAGANHVVPSQQASIGRIIARTAPPDGPAFFNGEVRGSEVYYAGRNIFEHVDALAGQRGIDEEAYVRSWSRTHGFDRAALYDVSGSYPWPSPQQLPRTLRITEVFTDGRPSVVETVTLAEKPSDLRPIPPSDSYSLVPAPIW